MITSLSQNTLHRFDIATRHEWLETDGLGGYASSTVIGAHTRRYHGLLVAATRPPVGRAVLLSKLDEQVLLGDKQYELSSNKYQGAIHPHGYIFMTDFEQGMFPRFTYQAGDITLRKTIVALHEQPTVVIWYEVLAAPQAFTMALTPLSAHRDYHSLTRAHEVAADAISCEDGILSVQPNPTLPAWHVSLQGGTFKESRDWYFGYEYTQELERGLGAHEDLFCPGKIYKTLEAGDAWGLIVSTNQVQQADPYELIKQEMQRRERLILNAHAATPLQRRLALAADQFIVRRDQHLKTIIAGYHWFTDWGRDTMISLSGLCLHTGREADAQKILQAFADQVSQGMIPNRFPDNGESPLYNNIDATLWFFVATYQYYRKTKDIDFIQRSMLPVLQEILDWHEKGTRYGIRMTEDGLLAGGEEGQQLTWMDAKAGDWVVTPREGKAVEVNALWYNAWKIFGVLTDAAGDHDYGAFIDERAEAIKRTFVETFWYEEGEYLYDLVNDHHSCTLLRPNQLFAISLPFGLLDIARAQAVLYKVEQHLLTPYGMRSLAPYHTEYIGRYVGDQYQRDGAYHQGTVWSWLIGPFIDALIKVKGTWGKEQALGILAKLQDHMGEFGLGSISEIFDGESPNTPKGCIAQAWSIAELIRVISEYELVQSAAQPQVRNKQTGKQQVVSQVVASAN